MAQVQDELNHTEDVLNDAVDEANDLIEQQTGTCIPATPRTLKVVDRDRKPEGMTPDEIRAKRPLAKKNDVEEALEGLVRRGGTGTKEAQKRLDDIHGLRRQLGDLNDELTRARAGNAPAPQASSKPRMDDGEPHGAKEPGTSRPRPETPGKPSTSKRPENPPTGKPNPDLRSAEEEFARVAGCSGSSSA